MEDMPIGEIIAIWGVALGALFGAVAQRTNFCTMGALSDWILMGEKNRLRSWFLAIAVGLIGTQILHGLEIVDMSAAIYLTPNLGWAGAVLGGAVFGYGMVLGGGCGNKTIVRMGAGNLKSVVVFLVLGVFAYMTVRGFIGPARLILEGWTVVDLTQMDLENQGIPHILSSLSGQSEEMLRWLITGLLGGGLLVYCFKDEEFRSETALVVGGIILGLAIPAAWYITGVLGYDDFDPIALNAFSFVAPSGDSIQYMMTFTGSTINFGISVVGGVILGSFLMSKATGTFHFEAFNGADDMIRHMTGGALMGVGGVLALGCTIGQGMSGTSTLALGSFIALFGIFVGAIFGLRLMEEGNVGDAIKAMFTGSD
ncbi:MAG: hypothetical protein COB46_08230 [Rhodospirillaceae bacterium]|nr:MAG: hypothetical protein COB46_08230 [Rhodospirillaceae bacterium]